jgi:hypothetical protein
MLSTWRVGQDSLAISLCGPTIGVQRTRDSRSVADSDALGPAPLTPVVEVVRARAESRLVRAGGRRTGATENKPKIAY